MNWTYIIWAIWKVLLV